MNPIKYLPMFAVLAFGAPVAVADEAAAAQEVVDSARVVFEDFLADPDMQWFRQNVRQAKGLLIVPHHGKAGFIIGGSGGAGALLARDKVSGEWSHPAFYTMGAASFGLQVGVQSSQLILMAMTEGGLDRLVAGKAQLGANASVAAGPVGVGAEVATTDIFIFARSKGVFGGLSAEGAIISPNLDRGDIPRRIEAAIGIVRTDSMSHPNVCKRCAKSVAPVVEALAAFISGVRETEKGRRWQDYINALHGPRGSF